MSKRLYFLISFVLVLALSGSVQAGTPLDVNNGSFEYDVDGNQITCSGGTMDDYIMGWYQGGAALYAGRSVSCACPSACDNCWDPNSTNFPDGYVIAFFQTDVHIYQITDHVFEVGRRYILSWEGLGWGDVMVGSLFYGDNPDANIVASESVALTSSGEQPWTWNHGELVFQVGDGAPCIGETIGIRLLAAGGVGDYLFADKVTLDKDWGTTAWDENPEDGSDEVDRDVVLEWRPGLLVADVNGHEVYFGTSFAEVNDANTATAGVYRGPDDVGSYADPCDANLTIYTYDPPETLELVKAYYWRVDEVNESYLGSDPPAGPWKGAVWSFEVEGRAKEPYPADDATGVVVEVVLHWTPGRDAATHDVYFGTDETAVSSATTLSAEFMVNQGPNTWDSANYDANGLKFLREYFWRIDEVNETASTLVKGDVWGFATSDHIDVDDFDSYADDLALRAVWKDLWSGSLFGKNGAEVFVASDPNLTAQSMEYYFRNFNSQGGWGYVGSEAEASTTDLEVGTDWTAGGVEALVVNFYGHTTNLDDTTGVYNGIHQDQMWVALEDGGANVGLVQWPDMNAIKEADWHEWNIDLEDPCLIAVDMNNVVKVYIGFGGQKVGQSKAGAGNKSAVGDTVWFDDIELWPPRCIPSYAEAKGDFDDDCVIDYLDLDNIGRDWLVSGGWVSASPPDANFLAGWYTLDEGVDQTAGNSGTFGSSHDGMLGNTPAVDACDPLWITDDPCAARQRCLEFDGATEYVEIPAFDFNTDGLTITAWVKRSGNQDIFSGIVVAADPCSKTKAGLQFGSTPSWKTTNTLNYTWPDDGPPYTWEFQSDLLAPDGEWVFAALTVEPTVGTLYMYDGTMQRATNLANVHMVEEFDSVTDIGWNRSKGVANRHFEGRIDEVHIYNYTLSQGEVLYLADPAGTFYQPLEDWRADIDGDDKVDVKDYVILANNWFDEILWP
jgi:hypothetical protein